MRKSFPGRKCAEKIQMQIELLKFGPDDISPNENGAIMRQVQKKPETRKNKPNDGATVTGK